MTHPIVSLVCARIRRRGSATLLSIAAITAATALVAIVSGIGLVASDATLQRALSKTGADRPVIRISNYSFSSRDADVTAATVTSTLVDLERFTGPAIRGVLVHELLDLEAPVFELLIAVDDPEPWTRLIEGRLPAPCVDGAHCEAVLLAVDPPDFAFDVARPAPGLELEIVGRGQLDPSVPFRDLDQHSPFGDAPDGGQYQTTRTSPAVILVNGVDALARSAALDTTGRTYVWTAPLDVAAIHPWSAATLRGVLDSAINELARADSGFTLASPMQTVDAELNRADAARGRLLLIGSLGVAILLAFAVFLALVIRDDVAAEMARLAAIGARRRDRAAFIVLEAAVPAAIGGVVGWVVGALVVGLLASWSGVDPIAVVTGTVGAPGAWLVMAAVLVVAVLAVATVSASGLPLRGTLRLAGAVAATAALILGWQLAAGGSIGSEALARSLASPIVVVMPPVVAFLLALGFVAALPPVLRALARRSRRAPLPVRLSVLSLSREPARPAATLTLLAFSLGAIIFAAGWSASLRQGIHDAAAYRSGLDLRVTEFGTGLSISGSVVPVDRYRTLGPDVAAIPVYRQTVPNHPGGRVEVVGLPPASLPDLPGWRPDFSATPVTDLAKRLTLPTPTGGWTVAGHRLAADADELVLRFRYSGTTLRLAAVVQTVRGDSAVISMGDVGDAMTEVRSPLPDDARGGLLIALVFRNPALIAGSGHQDELRRATITLSGLDGLVDEQPRDLEIFTVSTEIIRAPQVSDGLRLPAVVSPDLAATATEDGHLDLLVANDATVPLQVVGTASWIPSVLEPRPRFVLVPLDPFLVALTATLPGAGRPTEMWLGLPDETRLPAIQAALETAPFRFAILTTRAELVAERAGDPLSQAIVWTLVVAALAGLVLSIGGLSLGTVTDLRDERGELADLEAQGVTPTALRWHVLARTAWLAVGGSVAGIVVGFVLTVVITGALSLTAEGSAPIPPLTVVVPIAVIAVIVAAVFATVMIIGAWLTWRAFGPRTFGEHRARSAATGATRTWHASGERADG